MTQTQTRVLRAENISHSAIKKLDRERTVVVATLSPLEVHGPHLPLGQDIFEAYALAEKAAEMLAAERDEWTFLLLPPVPVATDCVPHMGSVNFPVNLVRQVAYHLLKPFAQHGFARLAISSFHGGPRHICALEAAADQINREFDVAAASLFSLVLARVQEGNVFYDALRDSPARQINLAQAQLDHHAGFVETSIGLHLWPELMEEGWESLPPCSSQPEDPAQNESSSHLFGHKEERNALQKLRYTLSVGKALSRAVKHYDQHTYHGYPALSSAEQGQLVFDYLAQRCSEILTEFLDRGRELDPHSPLWKFRRLFLSNTVNKIAEDYLKLYSQ